MELEALFEMRSDFRVQVYSKGCYETRNNMKPRAISTKTQSVNVRWRIKFNSTFLSKTHCNDWEFCLRRGFISPLDSGCQSQGVGQPFSLGARERQPLPEGFPPRSQEETCPLFLHLNLLPSYKLKFKHSHS